MRRNYLARAGSLGLHDCTLIDVIVIGYSLEGRAAVAWPLAYLQSDITSCFKGALDLLRFVLRVLQEEAGLPFLFSWRGDGFRHGPEETYLLW